MARTHMAKKQVQYPINSYHATALKTKLDDHDTALDALEVSGSALLVANAITANASGRAVFQDGLFDAATVVAKFAAGAIPASVAGRALLATGFFTEAKATDAFAAGAIVGSTLLKDATVSCVKLGVDVRSAPQALSGAGAINIVTATTLFTSTGATQALTLADSTVAGQRKRVIHIVDGGSGVITQTTGAKLTTGITTITFTNVYDWVELEWSGALWNVIGYGVDRKSVV